MKDIQKLTDKYYQARRAYDSAHAFASGCHAAMKVREYALVDAMIDEGIQKFDRDDGTSLHYRKKTSVSVTKENSDEIRDWLLERYGDDTDFLETKVSKQVLADTIRKELELRDSDGARRYDEEDYPAFLKLKTRPGLYVSGWKELQSKDE